MARKKVVENIPQLESWERVDEALAEIGRTQRVLEGIEMDMQARMDEYKAAAQHAAKPYQERVTLLEKAIKRYAEAHREDFGKSKTKALNFGALSFRKSTRVKLPKAATSLAAIIRRLKDKGMLDCIRQAKATIDKDALKKYTAAEIAAVGAELIEEEAFGYTLDQEKLENVEGAV